MGVISRPISGSGGPRGGINFQTTLPPGLVQLGLCGGSPLFCEAIALAENAAGHLSLPESRRMNPLLC
jgi:hypothetical protein